MRADITAALTLALALFPASASAFCRTTTIPTSPSFQPTETTCWTQGVPLFHQSQCVPYHISQKPSRSVAAADVSDALAAAFATWTAPNAICAPGIVAVEVAPVPPETPIVDYTIGVHEDNVIGFVAPWPHNDSSNTLSLTTLTFQVDTGEVFDADMEINDETSFTIATPPSANGYDFESVVVHEAGHFLGLAHTGATKAVMSPLYSPGSTKRTLDPDDQRGICSIYPSRAARATASGLVASSACNLAATAASSGSCGSDPQITHGCSTTPAPQDLGLGALAALAITTITTARFARRRRATRRR